MRQYVFFAVCLSLFSVVSGSAWGQDAANASQREKVKIEPYTGPSIYLPTSPQVEAQWVDKQVVTDKDDNGKVKTERQVSRFSDDRRVNDGFYREYYANGQLFMEGQFERGTRVGEWKYYRDNGQLAKTVNYEAGKPTGEVELRRADGTLEAKRVFDQAKRTGLWTIFDAAGEKPLREEHYADGKPDGVWKIWYPDGKLAQEISFRNGKQHGVATEWGKEGVKRAEVTFADGQRDGKSTFWTADGKIVEQNYRAGKLVNEPAAP